MGTLAQAVLLVGLFPWLWPEQDDPLGDVALVLGC